MDLAITRAKIKPNRPSGVLATRMVGLFVEVALFIAVGVTSLADMLWPALAFSVAAVAVAAWIGQVERRLAKKGATVVLPLTLKESTDAVEDARL